MRRAGGWEQAWFEVESFRVITDDDNPSPAPGDVTTEATIKVHVGGGRVIATAEGNGPVNALDTALRNAIGDRYPALAHVHLTDYKVRVLDTAKGTGAVTRVLVDSTNGDRSWTTIGVSENIIEASWQALYDSLVYGLLLAPRGAVALRHAHRPVRRPEPRRRVPARRPNLAPGVHLAAGERVAGRSPRRPRGRPAHRAPARPPRSQRRATRSRWPGASATRSRWRRTRPPTTRSRSSPSSR